MLMFLYQGDYDDERDIAAPSESGKFAPVYPPQPEYPQPQLGYLQQQPSYTQQLPGYPQQQLGYLQQQLGYLQQPRYLPQQPAYPHMPSQAPLPDPSWSKQSLLVNVQVYVLADKNDITALKKRAKEKYAEVVMFLWNTPGFSASANLLYDNTLQSDRLLRDVIAKTAKEHIRTLIYEEDFVEVMVRNGDLAVDVLKSVLL
jgi:hypothetical protein